MNRRTSGIAALTLAVLAIASAPSLAQDTEAQSLADAISAGKATFGFRYRYEYVGDDNPGLVEDTAHASTVRLRLNYKTAPYKKFTAFGEFDYIGEILLKEIGRASCRERV